MPDIDLDQYRSHGTHVFSGRERGEAVREAAELDQLDSEEEPVSIVIPNDTFSVTSSFFLGMFGDSIRRLGEEQFREHYRFDGPIMDAVVEDGIAEALREEAALGHD